MQIFKHNTHIPFVRYRYIAMTISLVLILTGIVSLIIHGGPNYGIDFGGGTLVQVKIHKSTDISYIRESLKGLKLGEVVIQSIGAQAQSEYLIRIEKSSTSLKGVSELVKERLIARFGEKTWKSEGLRWSAQRLARICGARDSGLFCLPWLRFLFI